MKNTHLSARSAGFAVALAMAPALAGCANTPAQQAQLRQIEQTACMIDGIAQPIGAAVLGALVPSSGAAVTVDQSLVHPAVAAYCNSLGGTPAKVSVPAVAP